MADAVFYLRRVVGVANAAYAQLLARQQAEVERQREAEQRQQNANDQLQSRLDEL
ncbi:MAG: hypothetical protein M0005_17360 [Actinomycetota bacterium]|nr:hypothetical protein [Actinomycetota bacterium]